MTDVIEEMLAIRRLERVAVNSDHARSVIDTAERHIRTATVLADTEDHAMACTAAYDAARTAIAAASEIVEACAGYVRGWEFRTDPTQA